MKLNLLDIQQVISKPELFVKFKKQIAKDFEMCGLDAQFIENLPSKYNQLFDELSIQINFIQTTSISKLKQLLYRIDISENQINHLSTQKNNFKFEQIIAELIIKRELQKIIFKECFK